MRAKFLIAGLLIIGGIFTTVFYMKANESTNTRKMITEAIQQRDTPRLIKELITRMGESLEKDRDTFPELIKEVETYTNEIDDPATKAILHSMVAEMYQYYYQAEAWKINRRTPISGYIPEDIREWTSNLFTDKIKEELTASLQPSEVLQQTPVSRFSAIIQPGEDSSKLRPTLYDFLTYRALQISPSPEIYENLIAFRRTQPEETALVLAELEYLAYKNGRQGMLIPVADIPYLRETEQQNYAQSLDSLLKIYKDKPVSVEIINARLNAMQSEMYGEQSTIDSIKKVQYNLIRETIARFPDYERINLLKNRLATLEQPMLSVQNDRNVYPGKELKIKLTYRNISQITIKLYESKRTPEQTLGSYSNYSNRKPETEWLGNLIDEYNYSLELKNSYTDQDTTITIPVKDAGLYELVVSSGTDNIRLQNLFSASRLATAFKDNSFAEPEVLVTDFLTGKPIEGAEVTYYERRNQELSSAGSVRTDKNGLAILPKNTKLQAYRATTSDDKSMLMNDMYVYNYREQKTNPVQIAFMTDRGIYRPGQTIFFKGIAYNNSDKENPTIITGQSFSVSFRDVNGKEITRRDFTSNEFGSFNGEFTIPSNLLNGMFSIVCEDSYLYVRVEEYKRPTFKVEISPIKEEVTLGQPLTIQGKAVTYSGVNVSGGEVSYRIMRRAYFPRIYYPLATEQVAEGNTTLAPDGTFSITFTPEKIQWKNQFSNYQAYQVLVTSTDNKGETQSEEYNFQVGESGILLSLPLGGNVNKDSVNVKVEARTYNNEPVTIQGDYTIYELVDTDKEGEYKENKKVATGRFDSDKPLDKSIFSRLPSGRYRIYLFAKDKNGNTSTTQNDFILYSRSDKQPPVFTHTWLPETYHKYKPGETIEILFGTSDKEAYILYEVYGKSGLVKRERFIANNENKIIRLPYQQEFSSGITVVFTFIKEGKFYTVSQSYFPELPDRSLVIRPETFRDRLLPGQSETWKFRITDKDSVPVSAELLAAMYDATLDKISALNWYFYPFSTEFPQAFYFRGGAAFSQYNQQGAKEITYPEIKDYQFDILDWQNVLNNLSLRSRAAVSGSVRMAASAESVAQVDAYTSRDLSMAKSTTLQENTVVDEDVATGGEDGSPAGIPLNPIRSNFNETAFFYPTLQTDKDGGVSISFTVPESNTTWNLRTLAHTKELKNGLYNTQVITQKQIMILPNLPRFIRQGDEVILTAQILNQSGKEISGQARLELFDPATDQPFTGISISQKPFTLKADSNGVVSWKVSLPAHVTDLTGLRIVAESNEGSDGEQHLIPVLPNEILVTESTPFYFTGSGEKQINIPNGDNSSTRRPYQMTLEVSANPVWYAVQALPTLTQPENENIIAWFASYFSNTLATSIVQAHPRIKQIIDAWTAEGGNAQTLYSNLQKNEELKSILLEETPWVLNAESETEQKQRLSLLFDINRANQQKQEASRVLMERQMDSGAWGWFNGFYPSRPITLYILKGMAQLIDLNAVQYNQQEKEMQLRALNYLDKSILEDYERLKSSKTDLAKYVPTDLQIDYLYVRSAYRDVPEYGEAREAIRYFTDQAEKQWEKASLYGKAETGLLMYRNGKRDVSGKITDWFRKTATTSDEMGMYWANNRRGESFLLSPVEVHNMILSLFNETTPNHTDTDLMKQWLLNQKRTQQWQTSPATVSAIYTLLLTGSDWLNENNNIRVTWGGENYNTNDGETATGYLKEVVKGSEINNNHQKITITKEGNAPAWGAVYNQYFETIDKVEKQKGALHVEKKLFIETNNGNRRQIEPVAAGQPLRIGDKVTVRLTIRTDREMQYVSLKDLRAGCFEPTEQISGLRYSDGLIYYRSPKDVSENFFFERLPVGTYVIEYSAYVSRAGEFSSGISTIQCMYAPEFTSHTEGDRIVVTGN